MEESFKRLWKQFGLTANRITFELDGRVLFWDGDELSCAVVCYGVSYQTVKDKERKSFVRWIENHGGMVSERDVQSGMRRFRSSKTLAENALNDLVSLDIGSWVHVKSGSAGGRPMRVFKLKSH